MPGSLASPSPEATVFPLVALLDAIEAWRRDPAPDQVGRAAEALGATVRLAGLRGAFLDVEIDPIPRLRAGTGTLARASASRLERIASVEVRVDEGRLPAGRLWLDGRGSDDDALRSERLAIRSVELAIDAVWSRATIDRTVERLEALDAATRGIAGVLSHERVLQLICDRTRDLVGAEYAALGIAGSTGHLERFVTSGISRAQRERIGSPPAGHGFLGLIVREGRTFRIPDLLADPRGYGFPPNHPLMHSFLGVPITVKGKSVGDLYLTNKLSAPEFSESDQQLVEMFALHAGIAIENARLHEQVQRLAVIDERERIGMDLHDGIIQGIYAVGLSLEDVPELMDDDPDEARARIERAIERLNLTIGDIRSFIFGLRPEMLDQASLIAGLAALVDEFRVNTMVDVEFVGADSGLDPGPDPTLQLLYIAREALSNIARHANATRALVAIRSLPDRSAAPDGPDEPAGILRQSGPEPGPSTARSRTGGDAIVLEVSDNGRGFIVDARPDESHRGLANMRSRAASLGGTFEVDSAPGAGTRIIVMIPLALDDQAAQDRADHEERD